MTRIGINGFGRIGRQTLKAIIERHPDDLEVVAINDLAPTATNAHLFKYDSTYGRFHGEVSAGDGQITIDGHVIKAFSEREPVELPWRQPGRRHRDRVDRHLHRRREGALAHLDAGASKVIISAPAKNEDITVVLGVNEGSYDPAKHHVVSNASCTTNGLALPAKVIWDCFGIEYGLMTTVHSYTNDQNVLDVVHKDLRRARSAGQNIIPTTHRRGQGAGPGHPGAEGPLRRLLAAGADRHRQRHRLRGQHQQAGHRGECQRRASRRQPTDRCGGCSAIPRRRWSAWTSRVTSTRQHRRRRLDHGRRREPAQGHRLVRQRVGLQLPGRRPRGVHGRSAVSRVAAHEQKDGPRHRRPGQTRLPAGRPQRPARRRADHR